METLTERERAYLGPRTDKPPGSVAWCWQTILLMQSRWKQKTIDEEGFEALVEELQAHEAWNIVPPEQPYGSLDALLEAEIGCTLPKARERFITEPHPKLGPRSEYSIEESNGGKLPPLVLSGSERAKSNNVSRRSQSKLDYLASEREDLLHEVQIGTMSIDKAYRMAKGLAPETPFEGLLRHWRRFSIEDQVRFVREMLSQEEKNALAEELVEMETRLTSY